MELWEEYLQRHGMPIIRPQEPFLQESTFYIPATPPLEHRAWAFFLMNNSYLIANHSYELEDQINDWCDSLLIIRENTMPNINEQRNIIFGHLPSLENLWNSWSHNLERFTSLRSLPNVQIQ